RESHASYSEHIEGRKLMSSIAEDRQDGDDEEFSISDLGITEYKRVVERPPRKFQPWHRPRKQFVRKSQWIGCLKDIYDNRDPSAGINYLGLPGTDLLDLRAFYDAICAPQQR